MNTTTQVKICEWCGSTGLVAIFTLKDGTEIPVRYAQTLDQRYAPETALESAMPCTCPNNAIRQKIRDASPGTDEIPHNDLGLTFDSYINERYGQVGNLARQLASFGKLKADNKLWSGLQLSGPTGTGKSTLASLIFRTRAENGEIGLWTKYTSMIAAMQATYKKDYQGPDIDVIVARYQNTPFLVIDELGQIRPGGGILPISPDRQEKLYSIIDYRWTNQLPTVVTDNLLKEQKYLHLGDAIVSRLMQLCYPVWMDGIDYRDPGARK